MRPGGRCRIPVVGHFRRRKTKTGRTFCRREVARVSAGSGQRGGRAWGGGGTRARPEHTKGTTLILPPCSSMCSVGHPCVIPAFILSFSVFSKNRATTSDIVVVFRGTVCQWYAEPEYPVEMRIRPHPALGQYRVLRSRFHLATFCAGRVDACAGTMPERYYIAQEKEPKNTSNEQAEPE